MLLQYGEDDEIEVKQEYRGKLRFLDMPEIDVRQELLKIKAPVFENEPWKLVGRQWGLGRWHPYIWSRKLS
jgi:hypothetical protein